MNKKFRLGLVAVMSTVLVSIPEVAHASDVYMGSSSGKMAAWYDDGGNRLIVCDNHHEDGIGAYVYMGGMGVEMTVYNGCETWRGTLPDNVWSTLQACDWVSVNGQRVGRNCSSQASFWS